MKKVITIIGIIILVGFGIIFGTKFANQEKQQIESSPASTDTQSTSSTQTQIIETKPSRPKKLIINNIQVNAPVEYVGLDSEKKMDVPKDPYNVGWYNLGPKPGEVGSAVMAGHLDTPTGAEAVFWDLKTLNKGDKLTVIDEQNNEFNFVVTRVAQFDFDKFPLAEVFATADKPRLNLITCEGIFDKSTKNYSQRTVVYSELIE